MDCRLAQRNAVCVDHVADDDTRRKRRAIQKGLSADPLDHCPDGLDRHPPRSVARGVCSLSREDRSPTRPPHLLPTNHPLSASSASDRLA